MDLSFTRFDRAIEVGLLPADLALLMVGVAARAAASVTAVVQAEIERALELPSRFSPVDGCFNPEVAAALARWKAR